MFIDNYITLTFQAYKDTSTPKYARNIILVYNRVVLFAVDVCKKWWTIHATSIFLVVNSLDSLWKPSFNLSFRKYSVFLWNQKYFMSIWELNVCFGGIIEHFAILYPRPKSPLVKGGFRGNVNTHHKCEHYVKKATLRRRVAFLIERIVLLTQQYLLNPKRSRLWSLCDPSPP